MKKTPRWYVLSLCCLVWSMVAGVPMAAEGMGGNAHQQALVLHKQGQLQEAGQLYLEAIAADPKNPVLRMDYADLLMLEQQFGEAKTHYQAAISLNPGNATAHTNLGLVYEALGDLDAAKREHQQALTIEPNHPQAHLNLGHVFEMMGFLEEAGEEYRKAIIINTNYLLAYESLAQVMAKTGDYEGSAGTYEKALSIKPDSAAIHNNLAHAYYKMGDYEKAVQELEKTLELDPENEVIRKNLAYLLEQAKSEAKVVVSDETQRLVDETLRAEEVSDDALAALKAPAPVPAAQPQVKEEKTPEPEPVSTRSSQPVSAPAPQEDDGDFEPFSPIPKAMQARYRFNARTGAYSDDDEERDAGAAEPERITGVMPSPLGVERTPPPRSAPQGRHGFTTQRLPMETLTARLYPVQGASHGLLGQAAKAEITERLAAALNSLGVLDVEVAEGTPNPMKDKGVDLVITATLTRHGVTSGTKEKFAGLKSTEQTTAEVALDLSIVDRPNQNLHTRGNVVGRAKQEGFLLFQDEMKLLDAAREQAVAEAARAVRELLLGTL